MNIGIDQGSSYLKRVWKLTRIKSTKQNNIWKRLYTLMNFFRWNGFRVFISLRNKISVYFLWTYIEVTLYFVEIHTFDQSQWLASKPICIEAVWEVIAGMEGALLACLRIITKTLYIKKLFMFLKLKIIYLEMQRTCIVFQKYHFGRFFLLCMLPLSITINFIYNQRTNL